jgi:hypothetical protein
MNLPVLEPESMSVIEIDALVAHCIVESCSGEIVRHSLGGAQSTLRCTRCFRRYQLRPAELKSQPPGRGAFRRLVDDFIAWRD